MEFWIGGTLDPVARSALEARKWKVEEKFAETLLKRESADASWRQAYRVFFTGNARRKKGLN